MISNLKQILKQPLYAIIAIEGMLGITLVFWWLLQQNTTLYAFYGMTRNTPLYFWPYIALTVLIVVLFGLSLAVSIYLWKKSKLKDANSIGGGAIGALAGAFGSVCPVCGAFLLSAVGLVGGAGILPFQGLEIKAISVAILGVAFWFSLKKLRGVDCKSCVVEDTRKGRDSDKKKMHNYSTHLAFIVIMFILGGYLWGFEASAIYGRDGSALSERINTVQTAKSENALYYEVVEDVLPSNGFNTGIVFGKSLVGLVDVGVIDMDKLKSIYERRGGLSKDQIKLLTKGSTRPIIIDSENAGFLVNMMWGLGLANYMEGNKESPINGEMLFRFAATGGWTLGKAKNGGEYFNKFKIIELTSEQEATVIRIAKSTYRPCCNNSTFFQDCNHGSALLGLLELGVSQGLSEEDLYKVALAVNSFWFPDTYIKTALYFKIFEEIDWNDIDAKKIMSREYSSASGWRQNIAQKISGIPNLIPEIKTSGGCGV